MATTTCRVRETREVRWRDLGAKQSDLRYLEMLQSLLERRLSYLRGRAERTEIIATAIARAVGFGQDHLTLLRLAARYHDLGLLGAPDAVLAAQRSLSADERRIIAGHVRMGGQLLSVAFPDYPEVLEMVWFHHERPDGQGPLGLAGELIPRQARIVAVSGAIEAMSSRRPHRAAMSRAEIVRELQRYEGTQFDVEIAKVARRNLRDIFAGLPPPEDIKEPEQAASSGPPDIAAVSDSVEGEPSLS